MDSRWESTGLRAAPWLALAVACGPLFFGGFPQGHDWTQELLRIAEYQAALAAGQLPPYWGENLYGGYGSPVFLFYAPLFSAGSALLGWLLGSAAGAATLLLILLTALSVVLTRRMLECVVAHGPGRAPAAELAGASARVGVYLYVLHPYLLGDELVRNASAEFAALCLAPLAIQGLLLAGSRPRAAFGLLSAGIALSILSHNLTALAVLGIGLSGALLLYPPWSAPRPLLAALGGMTFGLALSAFFWVPALSLLPLIRPEELLRAKFDFHGQFPAPHQLFGYGRFFATGLLTPLALLAAAFAAYRYRAERLRGQRLLVGALIAALGLLFLTTSASAPVWESVPLLPLFQFPWRMLGPLALVTAIVAALAFARFLAGRSAGLRVAAELAVLGACVLNALPLISQYRALEPSSIERLPELLDPEAVRSSGRSVTLLDEYLPRTADPTAWRLQRPVAGPVVATTARVEIDVDVDRGSWIELRTRASSPAQLRIARWFFPGWRLEVNGTPAELATNASGSLEVSIPEGEAHVELRYEPPRVRKHWTAVSGVALLAWIALIAGRPRRLWAALGPS